MTQERAKWREQAVNKIVKVALASQLKEVEQIQVQIKTDFSKLARGEVDSMTIVLSGLLIQQDLVVEELELQINHVVVKPRSAVLGKIKLTKPATGAVRVIFNEENLTRAINSESFYKHLYQRQNSVEGKQVEIHFQSIQCSLLTDGYIIFTLGLILDKTREAKSVTLVAKPSIDTDSNDIFFENVHSVEKEELPPEFISAFITQVSEVLSRRNFEKKGTSLQIQKVSVISGKLTLQASAYIEAFPA